MPKVTNNFHITVETNSRKHPAAIAVRGCDAGFHIKVSVRRDGKVSPEELDIYGLVYGDGALEVSAQGNGQDVVLLKGRR